MALVQSASQPNYQYRVTTEGIFIVTMTNFTADPNWMCTSAPVKNVLLAWFTLYILLLPLFFCVLYVGYTQRKKQAPSHYDVFTYNIVTMEIVTVIATSFYYPGVHTKTPTIAYVGDHLFIISITAQMFLHSFTCVERYLAVVHPITYLRLKKRGGVTIRNMSIVGALALSIGVGILENRPGNKNYNQLSSIFITSFALAVVIFCSVSVLCVLVRPRPGKAGKNVRRVDQSKRRAFFTMIAITGVLTLRFWVLVPVNLVFSLHLLEFDDACLFSISASWCYLPSSLVPPLMFLHKAGRLPKCSI